jgi:hypothetical protein
MRDLGVGALALGWHRDARGGSYLRRRSEIMVDEASLPERELATYRRIAASIEADARNMLDRLRQLARLRSLSMRDRALIAAESERYRESINEWETRRAELDQLASGQEVPEAPPR